MNLSPPPNKILILDNYDSFTYNLVHLIEKIIDSEVDVFRNDEISLSEIKKYDTIILSPGPGLPKEAGILNELIVEYASTKNILGVCLGHQAIAEVFGAKLKNLNKVHHGVGAELIFDSKDPLFKGMDEICIAGRYHSWVVERNSLPKEFKVIAEDKDAEIMAFRHNKLRLTGVQFHPESVLTPQGEIIMRNFLLS